MDDMVICPACDSENYASDTVCHFCGLELVDNYDIEEFEDEANNY